MPHAKKSGHNAPTGTKPRAVMTRRTTLQVSPVELQKTLHPDKSGFRAEIYIPDAAMQQAGFKTTLALKGSAGTVIGPDGKPRDTTAEDFGANNFPQSIGLETDYYDRAMNLGRELKRNGVDFESTGHSLAGGMAAAVAATTHTQATTFNAAGLNPITTERFARQHPGVVVSKDLTTLITNYQVQGELLDDGVQGNIHNMDALRRQRPRHDGGARRRFDGNIGPAHPGPGARCSHPAADAAARSASFEGFPSSRASAQRTLRNVP